MVDRVLRDFRDEDIHRIADTFQAWRGSNIVGAGLVPAQGDHKGRPYANIPGFCKSVTLDEIKAHDYPHPRSLRRRSRARGRRRVL